MGAKPTIAVLGIDGATYDLLDPWMSEGLLPNTRRIIESGVRMRLRSTKPPISPAAWSAFMTGANPGKTGIGGFTGLERGTYQVQFMNGGVLHEPTIWHDINGAGHTVGVLNVPMTYPPEQINGWIVSGLDTSGTNEDFTYPAELKDSLNAACNGYEIDLRHQRNVSQRQGYAKALESLLRLAEKRGQAMRHLLSSHPIDVFVGVFTASDRAGHMFWHLTDPRHPHHDPELVDEFGDPLLTVYQQIDRELGTVLDMLPNDCTVLLMSDHGMGPLLKDVDLNGWLAENGFLTRQASHVGTIRKRVGKLVRNLWDTLPRAVQQRMRGLIPQLRKKVVSSLGFQNIDWKHTKAFAIAEQVYINHEDVYPEGCVPGDEVERLKKTLKTELKKIRDPDTNERVISDVKERHELYRGPQTDLFGDLIVQWNYEYEGRLQMKEQGEDFIAPPPMVKGTSIARSGGHVPDGIFAASGPPIRKGKELKRAHITEIAPTVLELLGIAPSENMDGSTISRIFKDGAEPGDLQEPSTRSGDQNPDDNGYSDEEAAAVEQRLKDLGYM